MNIGIEVKIIALLLAVIALGISAFGLVHYGHSKGVAETTATYETALSKQKAAASLKLADETAKTRSIEQALQTFKNEQDLKDEKHQTIVAAMSTRLRGLAGPAGRLRDPNQTGCGSGGGGAQSATATATADRADDRAETGGLLSGPLTDLFLNITREADEINVAYTSCRADSIGIRKKIK